MIQRLRSPPARSESQPAAPRSPTAIPSAIPSTTPSTVAGAPSVTVKNSGTIGYTSSLAKSFANDTHESARTFCGSPCCAASTRLKGLPIYVL